MSVPSYRRTENKFEVLNIAMEVFNLTLSLIIQKLITLVNTNNQKSK